MKSFLCSLLTLCVSVACEPSSLEPNPSDCRLGYWQLNFDLPESPIDTLPFPVVYLHLKEDAPDDYGYVADLYLPGTGGHLVSAIFPSQAANIVFIEKFELGYYYNWFHRYLFFETQFPTCDSLVGKCYVEKYKDTTYTAFTASYYGKRTDGFPL